ncbi:MAG: putative collagen-binding domain-containing protein [Candidatus Latescibacterota bacterium]
MRSPASNLAVVYLTAGGEVHLQPGALPAGLSARWFNPRTGDWSPAQPAADGSFVAADRDDWVLLFR